MSNDKRLFSHLRPRGLKVIKSLLMSLGNHQQTAERNGDYLGLRQRFFITLEELGYVS